MHDPNTTTREFIERHVGGRWRSLCVTPERDNLGSPVTISNIGEDLYATHLQSSLMPLPQARYVRDTLQVRYRQLITVDPTVSNEPGFAVLRMNIEKARVLEQNPKFDADTHQASLTAMFERGPMIG